MGEMPHDCVLTVNTSADNTAADEFLALREAIRLINVDGDANAALGRPLTAGEAAQVIASPLGTRDEVRFAASADAQPISLTLGQLDARPISRLSDFRILHFFPFVRLFNSRGPRCRPRCSGRYRARRRSTLRELPSYESARRRREP
jgi:hypothetical protein